MLTSNPKSPVQIAAAAALQERREFAMKIRAARAVLGWSQAELGARVGVTQRSINRLERAEVDVRHSTVVAIERLLRGHGIAFESRQSGGFTMFVSDGLVAP
jgi:ribosome-binding protein aMBF1 (putative translation factor)